jgi:hypothetical protein
MSPDTKKNNEENKPKEFQLQLGEILSLSDEMVDHSTAVQTLYNNLNESYRDLSRTFTVEQNKISEEKAVSGMLVSMGKEMM